MLSTIRVPALRILVEHGRKKTMLVFDELPIRIGRAPSNDCRLELAFVSRMHARIELRDGRLLLRDEGSRHGTWTVGGGTRLEPGQPVDLAAIHYAFQIGAVRLRVLPIDRSDWAARVETLDADLAVGPTPKAPGESIEVVPPPLLEPDDDDRGSR